MRVASARRVKVSRTEVTDIQTYYCNDHKRHFEVPGQQRVIRTMLSLRYMRATTGHYVQYAGKLATQPLKADSSTYCTRAYLLPTCCTYVLLHVVR